MGREGTLFIIMYTYNFSSRNDIQLFVWKKLKTYIFYWSRLYVELPMSSAVELGSNLVRYTGRVSHS